MTAEDFFMDMLINIVNQLNGSTRLAFREKGTGADGGDKSFGIIQRVEAPKEEDQRDALRMRNDLLCRQNFVS